MAKRSNYLFAIIAVCFACGGKLNSDRDLLSIVDLQDKRKGDSLLLYVTRETTNEVKSAAALALGSVQDSTTAVALGDLLLNDTSATVKLAAAFSLGQIANHTAVNALIPATSIGNAEVRREAFEALGKGIEKQDLKTFSQPANDTVTLNGIAWGIYRAGVRGVLDTATVTTAARIISNPVANTSKLGAAHFFQRSSFPQLPGLIAVISAAANNDPNVDVRMSATRALGKFGDDAVPAIAISANDNDYRVRVNAALALRNKSWKLAKPLYEKLLADSNVSVAVATGEVVAAIAPKDEGKVVLAWAKNANNWRTQANLYGCAVKLSPSPEINTDIKAIYSKSDNPYQQAALLTALSHHVDNYPFLFEATKSNLPVIKSTASDGLEHINHLETFPASLRQEFATMYQQLIEGGDLGAIISACSALGDTTLGYKSIIKDFSFLETAKNKLSLPRDYETYVPIDRTLAYFKGLPKPPRLENKYNNPIDLELLKKIKPDQHVIVKTTKGDIEMILFPGEAPGSVVNFVKLINQKYFDGKVFHRVVPNFVIQTGCNRGDGFGSEDYSIRSEFNRRKYKTGSVGMASAGKDTEGTQWFITHSPTPHLDGKYTIFAEVVRGMDVVHDIQVGDTIIEARLID